MKNKIYNEYQNYKDYINDYFGKSKLNENISLKDFSEEEKEQFEDFLNRMYKNLTNKEL